MHRPPPGCVLVGWVAESGATGCDSSVAIALSIAARWGPGYRSSSGLEPLECDRARKRSRRRDLSGMVGRGGVLGASAAGAGSGGGGAATGVLAGAASATGTGAGATG